MSIALNSDLFPEDSNVKLIYHEDEITSYYILFNNVYHSMHLCVTLPKLHNTGLKSVPFKIQ